MIQSEEKSKAEIKETLEDMLDINIPKFDEFNYIKERETENAII